MCTLLFWKGPGGVWGTYLAGSQELHSPGHLEAVAHKVFHGQWAQPEVLSCTEGRQLSRSLDQASSSSSAPKFNICAPSPDHSSPGQAPGALDTVPRVYTCSLHALWGTHFCTCYLALYPSLTLSAMHCCLSCDTHVKFHLLPLGCLPL